MAKENALREGVEAGIAEVEAHPDQFEESAAEDGAEIPANEEVAEPAKPPVQNASPANEGAQDEWDSLPENKAVPYDRFKKLNEARKEHVKKLKELEERFKDLDPDKYRQQSESVQKLVAAVGQHPWLDKLLTELLENKPNWQSAFQAIQQLVIQHPELIQQQEQQGGVPPVDPRVTKLEEQQKNILYQMERQQYAASVARQLDAIRRDPELKDFTQEDIDEVLNRGIAENQVTKKEPDLVKLARQLAKYGASIKERVLKAQAAGAGKKQSAAAEKGGGAPGSKPFVINPNSPTFLRDLQEHGPELLEGREG